MSKHCTNLSLLSQHCSSSPFGFQGWVGDSCPMRQKIPLRITFLILLVSISNSYFYFYLYFYFLKKEGNNNKLILERSAVCFCSIGYKRVGEALLPRNWLLSVQSCNNQLSKLCTILTFSTTNNLCLGISS